MQVPLSWLKDFVTIDLPVAEVDRVLTNAGLEVKGIDLYGLPGAELEWDREKIVLGHILNVEQHPAADRLVLASVEYGAAEPKVVVTGAPNLFPYVGQGDISAQNLYSPLALEGAELYDGHKDGRSKMKLKGRALRGVYNDAMLCSEKELGLSDSHEGVIIMRKDAHSPDYRPGVPAQDVLGDAVLEIDIIPNIARCASMLGVAREYAALTNQPLRAPDTHVEMAGPPVNGRVRISTENPELNPRFVGLVIEGVSQQPSPYWMQHRLRLAGQRPINVVVDVSNYVMLEIGQPNHTFDYDYLRRRADQVDPQGPIHIITRLPRAGETLTTLDGVVHKLPGHTILVTDPVGALSLGGIMGGLESEIKDDTTNVLLEAAAWNFINIRRSATDLGIHSEAAFRFSRGVHPSQALLGAQRAAGLLQRLAGGTVWQGIVDAYPAPPEPVTVALDPVYVRRLSGLDLSPAAIGELLQRLAFTVQPQGETLLVTAPDTRMDIEGPHDLVEEICRLYGYDNIPATILADALPPQRGNPLLEREEQVRDLLVQLGLQEVITYRLTSPAREGRLFPPGSAAPAAQRPYVALTNPISVDRAVLRQSVLASVLEMVAANSRFQTRIALFEIGAVYHPQADELLPAELPRLALAMTGPRAAAHWQGDAHTARLDFFDLKGILEALFNGLHLDARFEPAEHPTFRPGRTAQLLLGKSVVGFLGELHPHVAEAFDARLERDQAVLAADLDLQVVLEAMGRLYPYEPISPYPAVREDLALVVDQATPARDVEKVLFEAGGALLTRVELFDVYTGAQIPPGKKSLAYHLTFQSPNKTLTDKDVAKQRQRLVQQLARRLGASLRA
jgi:phenylalanyl-tRNA synthetase beta chain